MTSVRSHAPTIDPSPADPGRPSPTADPGRPSSRHPWRPLLVRLHFYAGVLTAPFVILVCLSGLAYALTPQLDRLVYANDLVADPAGRAPLPLADQVAAAVRSQPTLALAGVRLPDSPQETTEVNFADPALTAQMAARTVYVDPYTGAVRGSLVTRHGTTPLTTWLGQFHANLQLGQPGRVYAELASAWLLFVAFGGLFLWWERARRHQRTGSPRFWRRLLWPDRSRPGLHRTMSWHSTVGLWALVIVVVLAVTGLLISPYAGTRWTALSTAAGWTAPRLDATLPVSAANPAQGSPNSAGADEHSGHAGHGGGGSAARVPGVMPAGRSVDEIVEAAARAGITDGVSLTTPARPGTGWTVAETDLQWPVHLDQAVIDPTTGAVVRTLPWEAWPLGAQIYRLTLFFHFGRTFGGLNQILLIVAMVGALASSWWGYRMWWQRRPRRSGRPGWRPGRAPRRGAWRAAPRGRLAAAVALTIGLVWAMPVFGVTLAVFLVIDALLGLRHRHPDAPPPAPEAELVDASAASDGELTPSC